MTGTVTADTHDCPTRDTTPFEYCFHVPRDPRAVGVARTSLRAVLIAYEIPELIDRAELLTSELLTNAIVHARSEVELRFTWAQETLRLAVWDTSTEPPNLVDSPDDSEHGRGLRLLAILADRWDHFFVRTGMAGSPNKVVWCEVDHRGASTK